MLDPFLSQMQIFAFNFAPRNWAQCNGQLLPINQNQALFSLLGTTYGGNGSTNFALPDFRGRVPMHFGNGMTLGERAGTESVSLNVTQLPTHSHNLNASGNVPNATAPTNNFFPSNSGMTLYSNAPTAAMSADLVTSTGGSQPHENRQPYLVLNICIALAGIFPSQT